MKAQELPGKIKIDPYGHKQFVPKIDELPEGSLFVARARIWLEAIWTEEQYWLHQDFGKKTYSLWSQIHELRDEYCCSVLLDSEVTSNLEDIAQWLLLALWCSRISEVMAMSLGHLVEGGLVSLARLDELADSYHNAANPPEVPEGAETVFGGIFYETGELKYQGEHWQEQAHGRGTAFWKNGNIWCKGSFESHQPQGYCRMYFRDGTLRHEGYFENGLPKDPGREFFENGQVRFDEIWGEAIFLLRLWGQDLYRGQAL